MFNFSPKWNFPSNNHSQTIGIADSGVETFKGTPIKSLAREICQNSLDARLDNSQPARIEFETFEIDPKTIPDAGNLKDVFNRCLEFWKVQDSNQARKFFNQAIKDMNHTSIKCLRISDFNTSGLTGSHEEYNSPWCNLTKSSGTSNKSGGHGGSFGIGKFAPFACSSLRTVFYSTYDINKTSASQGVSRLTTFKNKKGDTTQGIGFYGNDKNTPMYNQYSLNPKYSRPDNSTGADIFIAGFTGEKNWEHQMVASILDGFLYAIFQKIMDELNPPILSIPGVGIQSAAMILAEIGDFSNFESPDKILAYAGCSPSTYQSGKLTNCYAHMEKRGSRYLRYALYNATKYVCHWNPVFAEYLAKKRAEGKHYNVALSHATKKLVRLIYALQKSGKAYLVAA